MLSRLRAVVVAGILVVWLAAGATPGWGQGRGIRGPVLQPKLPDLRLEGSLDDLGSGMLQILSDAGQPWRVRVAPNAVVRVTGKAAADFLAPSQCIALLADVDVKRSRIERPVSRLLIYSVSLEWPLGAFPEQSPGSGIFERGTRRNGEQAKSGLGLGQQGPAMGPGAGVDAGAVGGDARSGSRKSKSPPAKAGASIASATQSLEIRGQITALKAGILTLRVPTQAFKSPLRIEIAESTDIDLDLSGLNAITLAQKGDKIQVRGQQLGERMGQAQQIEITLSQPAGMGESKKRPAGKAASKPSKPPAGVEEPAPKE